MDEEREWWREYFDDEFVELYAPHLPPERSRWEAEAVVEILGLEPGSRLLDLACGWGRHAIEFARLGCDVTGLDGSDALLRRARSEAEAAGVRVSWVRADMREIPDGPPFDAIVSLFSSLGYFASDGEDVRVLRGVRRALGVDGIFLMETMHRDQVARGFLEHDWWEGPGGAHVWVERGFDAVAGVSEETLRWRRGEATGEKRHSIRIRSATEWADALGRAGLEPIAIYGDWDFSPFTHLSERLIAVARPDGGEDPPA